MKNKSDKWERGTIAALTMAALTLFGMLLGPIVMGATVNTLESFGFPWSDTAFFVIRLQSNSSLVDSTMFDEGTHTFPFDTNYTWDDTRNYSMKRGQYFPGDGWGVEIDYNIYVTGGAAGTGPFSVSIVTLNAADSTVIGGVPITVRTVDQSSLVAVAPATDDLGLTSWNGTADSFLYITNPSGFTGPTYDTVVIAGAQTDTIFLTAFDPGAPAAGSFCRVYGYLMDLRDVSGYGPYLGVKNRTVCATALKRVPNVCNNTWNPGISYCVDVSDSGYFFIDLVKSYCLPDSVNRKDSIQYLLKLGEEDLIQIWVPDSNSFRVNF